MHRAIAQGLYAASASLVCGETQATRVRIKLFGGALSSISAEALLAGGNSFAIEGADGEWEIVQARACVLVAAGEYELSGFLRGQLGTAHAMRSPHPVGARIVKLDARLARLEIGAHQWGQAPAFAAPPAGALESDTRASHLTRTLPHAEARPWAPAHVRAKRLAGGDVAISWIGAAPSGGDFWGAGDPPIGFVSEAYQLDIFDGAVLKRSVTAPGAQYTYTSAAQTADFGALPASLRLRVAQIGEFGATGLNKELTILL